MSEGYNPKVLGLCCRWCSYAGADLAGAMRLQYPPAVKIMMLPCTGRVDILHILRAFEAGWDTVFVSGCHEGDCHYLAGNIQARKRVAKIEKGDGRDRPGAGTPGNVLDIIGGRSPFRQGGSRNDRAGRETRTQPGEAGRAAGLAGGPALGAPRKVEVTLPP